VPNASITITGSSSYGASSDVDNGFLMSNSKRRSISDEASYLLPWAKCRFWSCSRIVMLAAKADLSCTVASVITNQIRTINIGRKTKPCLIRISIAGSTMNLSLKPSSLSHSPIAFCRTATRVYLTGTDESGKSV